MPEAPTLETERFVLRELVRADAAALMPTFADDASMRWWSRAPFTDLEVLADYLVERSDKWDGLSWSITEREGGAVVGRIVAGKSGEGVFEIGYLVVKDRMAQGIARETVPAVIDHLFADRGCRRIFADVDPDNEPSNRLMKSLGFTLEGRLREHWITHIGQRDSYIWGLLADEWHGSPR